VALYVPAESEAPRKFTTTVQVAPFVASVCPEQPSVWTVKSALFAPVILNNEAPRVTEPDEILVKVKLELVLVKFTSPQLHDEELEVVPVPEHTGLFGVVP